MSAITNMSYQSIGDYSPVEQSKNTIFNNENWKAVCDLIEMKNLVGDLNPDKANVKEKDFELLESNLKERVQVLDPQFQYSSLSELDLVEKIEALHHVVIDKLSSVIASPTRHTEPKFDGDHWMLTKFYLFAAIVTVLLLVFIHSPLLPIIGAALAGGLVLFLIINCAIETSHARTQQKWWSSPLADIDSVYRHIKEYKEKNQNKNPLENIENYKFYWANKPKYVDQGPTYW